MNVYFHFDNLFKIIYCITNKKENNRQAVMTVSVINKTALLYVQLTTLSRKKK